ncbi:alpha/beta hydrolase family protein [Actinomycetospora sp. CA-053990]|uniref:alpha/beta hydrolase family protein n=1 Tax=Actinomycetospora sp. CA-053990 TaxID=3239891 RepID=UPI003D94475E
MAIGLRTLPEVLLTYPSLGDPVGTPYGRFAIDAVPDGPVAGRPPLVLLSHGTGSTPDVYRGLAADLAHAGFAVAALSHAGNRLGDDGLAGTAEVLTVRTRQSVEAVDLALEALGASAEPPRIGLVGHSLGAATALALAGARPHALPWETADGVARPIAVSRDERVAALVLLMPATPWFDAPGALAQVDVPTVVLTAEHDEHTPAWHGALVTAGVPHATHHVVEGAGHFAALTPFGPRAVAAGLPPALDPPGFDRAGAQRTWHPRIAAWLAEHL